LTSYSCFQAKFFDIIGIFFYSHTPYFCKKLSPVHSPYNKVFVKYQAQGGLTPTPLVYALDIGYTTCVEQNQPFFVWDFSTGIFIQADFSPLCYCVSNISPTDNYQILSLVFILHNDFTFYPKFTQRLN